MPTGAPWGGGALPAAAGEMRPPPGGAYMQGPGLTMSRVPPSLDCCRHQTHLQLQLTESYSVAVQLKA